MDNEKDILINQILANIKDLIDRYNAVVDLCNDLKAKYNDAVNLINDLKAKFNSHTHGGVTVGTETSGAPTVTTTVADSVATPVTNGVKVSMLTDIIKR